MYDKFIHVDMPDFLNNLNNLTRISGGFLKVEVAYK
jgi:hypothetical protein